MNWLFGWIREHVLSWDVNKIRGLVPVDSAGHYKAVAEYYFTDKEMFALFDNKRMVELHGENWCYVVNKVKMFYVNVITGAQIMFGGAVPVVYKPELLAELFDVNDIKAAGKGILGGFLSGGLGMLIVGVVIGGLGGYLVAGMIPKAPLVVAMFV